MAPKRGAFPGRGRGLQLPKSPDSSSSQTANIMRRLSQTTSGSPSEAAGRMKGFDAKSQSQQSSQSTPLGSPAENWLSGRATGSTALAKALAQRSSTLKAVPPTSSSSANIIRRLSGTEYPAGVDARKVSQATSAAHDRICKLGEQFERSLNNKEQNDMDTHSKHSTNLDSMTGVLANGYANHQEGLLPTVKALFYQWDVDFKDEQRMHQSGYSHSRMAEAANELGNDFQKDLQGHQSKSREFEKSVLEDFDAKVDVVRAFVIKESKSEECARMLKIHIEEDVPRLWESRKQEAESRETMEGEIIQRANVRIKELQQAFLAQREARIRTSTTIQDKLKEMVDGLQAELAQERCQRLAIHAMIHQVADSLQQRLLDDRMQRSQAKPEASEREFIAYLPKRIDGIPVVHQDEDENGRWYATNVHWQSKLIGIAYRITKDMEDRVDPLQQFLPWGKSCLGVDDGEWVIVKLDKAALDVPKLDMPPTDTESLLNGRQAAPKASREKVLRKIRRQVA